MKRGQILGTADLDGARMVDQMGFGPDYAVEKMFFKLYSLSFLASLLATLSFLLLQQMLL